MNDEDNFGGNLLNHLNNYPERCKEHFIPLL